MSHSISATKGIPPLVFGPGATSHPIVNYEYATIKVQSSAALATDIQAVLYFATLPQYGNSAYFLDKGGVRRPARSNSLAQPAPDSRGISG